MTSFRKSAQIVEKALSDQLASLQVQLHELLTRLDPWSSGFSDKAWQGIERMTQSLWPELRRIMPGHSDLALLQQAWAARFESRVHIGLLYRAGLTHPDLTSEAIRLHALTLRRWRSPSSRSGDVRHRGLVNHLMAPNPQKAGIPDLGPHTRFKGSIRLRYRIARICDQGGGLSAAINAAARQPAATAYQRRIELSRAVQAGRQAGRSWQPLTDLSFALLVPGGQKLLLSVPHLWPQVLSPALSKRIDLQEHFQNLMTERDRVEQVLSQVMQHVRSRRLEQIDPLIDQLPETPFVEAMGRRLKDEPWALNCDLSHPSTHPSFGPWTPMSPNSLRRLQAWAPSPLPAWWALKPSDLARDICRGKLAPEIAQQLAHTPQDLAPLRRQWTEAEQRALIRSGHVRLATKDASVWNGLTLPELAAAVRSAQGLWTSLLADRLQTLPDASPWLELMSAAPTEEDARELRTLAQLGIDIHWRDRADGTWGIWIAGAYGCKGWDRIEAVALSNTLPIRDATLFNAHGRQPKHPEAFRAVVARSLHKPDLLPPRPMLYIKRWVTQDPQGAAALAEHAPVQWVERLVANPTTPLPALDAFMASPHLAAPLKRRVWRNRLSRTTNAKELAQLSAQMPASTGRFSGLSQWLVSGDEADQATALVLTARRDGPRLYELCTRFGAEVFLKACRQASEILLDMASDPTAPGSQQRGTWDAAALELLTHLGPQAAPYLMPALNLCRSQYPTGWKVQGAYTEHHIPKARGGTRRISAPHPLLKKAQRFILDKLLAPLGAHPAAQGFVPGRSIVDNARAHVGQKVVINADIRNCFPSVRWSLVLGALKQELGERLSAQAISILVDLCTERGVLPIGAPTSPALLNLVLKRTDILLHQSAQSRGWRYTRYADDLTFSGDDPAVRMLGIAQRVLRAIDLQLDPRKTNIFRRGRRQMVTGLVVNQKVGVPRSVRRRLRAAVHHVECNERVFWDGQTQSISALQGRLAFVAMACKPQAQPLIDRLRKACTEVIQSGARGDKDATP